jgi:hypothetical protein
VRMGVESLVEELSPKMISTLQGLHVTAYRAILDVPRALAKYLGCLLRAERRERGTPRRSRSLTCFRQAGVRTALVPGGS